MLVGDDVDALTRPWNIWLNDNDDEGGAVPNAFADSRANEDDDAVLVDDGELLCDCLRALARRFWNQTYVEEKGVWRMRIARLMKQETRDTFAMCPVEREKRASPSVHIFLRSWCKWTVVSLNTCQCEVSRHESGNKFDRLRPTCETNAIRSEVSSHQMNRVNRTDGHVIQVENQIWSPNIRFCVSTERERIQLLFITCIRASFNLVTRANSSRE